MKIAFIDSHGFFFKAHYALQRAPLRNSRGEATSVIYSFLNLIYDVIRNHSPEKLICVLDAKGKCFRHEKFPDYKANRSPAPDELIFQIQAIEEILPLIGIPLIKREGYEADDIIAHYALVAAKTRHTVDIFSGDKDLLQLVSPTITVVKSGKKVDAWERVDETAVEAKYKIPIATLVNYFALVGDSSDNIPGVKGVGPVMAAKLMSTYPDLETLYDSLSELKPPIRAKLEQERDNAFLSRDLINLRETHIDTIPELSALTETPMQSAPLVAKLKHYECFSLIKKFDLTTPERIAFNRTFRNAISDSIPLDPNQPSSPLTPATEEPFPFANHFTRHDITNPTELTAFLKHVAKHKSIIFDLETTSLNPFEAEVISFAAVCEQQSYFMLCQRRNHANASQNQIFSPPNPTLPNGALPLDTLKNILEDSTIQKIGHNLKYEYEILKCQGITLRGIFHDTLLYEYLLDADRNRLKLEEVFRHYTKAHKTDYKALTTQQGRDSIFDVPLAELRAYAMEDTEATTLIYQKQQTLSKKETKLFQTIELPLIRILGEMELTGVLIDKSFFRTLEITLSKSLNQHEQTILELAGEPFNINSTKQLQHILFEKLNLRTIKKIKTGFSTDNSVLEELKSDHPIIPLLLDYRKEAKLLSTYVKTLPTLVHPQTGRIHSNYHQAVAGTGRLSSQNPNLQNIPIGKESFGIRKGFIAPPKHQIVSFDYSQIELRVLAYMSGDETLLNAYQHNQDIHIHTASLIYNKEHTAVTKEERDVGKTINFSIIYGVSAFALAKRFKISLKEAKIFMEVYFENYPGVTTYREQILETARKNLYIETFYGRKRYVRGIVAKDKLTQQRSERMAFNAVIQGTAADIMKLAMIAVHQEREAGHLSGELVMQVHDELVFYIKENATKQESEIIQNLLRNIKPFEKILDVGLESGVSWEK